MADGKNIEIKIAAVGGQQAAADFEKLDAALGIVTTSAGQLASQRAQFLTAAEAETAEILRETQALDKMEQKARAAAAALPSKPFSEFAGSLGKVTDAGNKVTRSGVQMGTGFQNVGYQVQDLAVQIGSGSGVMRAMSQQIPQLLSGFGPLGIAIGTVSAVALPVAGALFNMGQKGKDAGEELDVLTGIVDDYAAAAKKAALARDVENLGAYFDALDDEEAKISAISDSLDRQIQLTTKLDTLKRGVEAAQRDLAVANIASDPHLSDADKTRQIADFKEKDAREKVREEIAKLAADKAAADKAATEAQQKADREAADAEAAAAKRAEIEAEQARNAKQAEIAKTKIPQIQSNIASAESSQRFMVDPETGADLPGRAEKLAEIARMEKELAQARKDSGGDLTPEQRKDKQTKDEALVAEAKNDEAKQKKQAEDARKDSEKAYKDKLYQDALVREGAPLIASRYQSESQARAVRTEETARKQEEAAAARQAAEEKSKADKGRSEAERQRNAGRELETDITGIGRDAADATRGLGARGVNPEGFNSLAAKIAKKGNPQQDKVDLASFLAKVSQLVDAIPDSKSGSDQAQKLIAVERKLEKKIADLNSRVRRTEGK